MAEDIDRRPIPDPTVLTTAQLLREIAQLKELFDERFGTINLRFSERDLRFAQQAVDSQLAIDRALANLNVVLARLETQFGKQIDAMTQRVDDLKTNVSEIQGNRQGSVQMVGWGIGAAGVILAVVTAAFSIVHFVPK